jgi:hypothetical protein
MSASISPRSSMAPRSTSVPTHSTSTPVGTGVRDEINGTNREIDAADDPAVYRAFCTAKDRMQEQYVKGMTFNNMSIMLPWCSNLIDEDRALLGDDWWPYGIQRNRSAIDVVLRYHYEQGLTKRRLTIEDVFFPDLLDT